VNLSGIHSGAPPSIAGRLEEQTTSEVVLIPEEFP
jgi:hypothetical protein